MVVITQLVQPSGAEIGIKMKTERMKEILVNIVNFVAVANNTSVQIEELLKYGFEAPELTEFGYSKADLEAITGEEIPEPAKEGFMNPPKYDSHEIATRIADILDHNELSSGDISVVFRALHRQDNCLGGKIWSPDDIRSQIVDNYPLSLSDNAISIIANEVDGTIDDCTDSEWMSIDEAIRRADIKIKITDIEWDIDKDDFDDEAEYETVIASLPVSTEVPFSALEDYAEIEDYLTGEYDYCVKSFNTEEVLE